MQFMFQYPETNGTDTDMLNGGNIDQVARAAEETGFMGFAFTEHPAPGVRWIQTGGHQTLDPFVALAFAAAATSRIRLLTYLAVVPYRNPLLLAKAAATVDRLSGGRFILGVGTGYLKGEFRALGVDFEERNQLFDEALDVLPLHWQGQPFDYKGIHFEAREVIARPRPAQSRIPIWIGGNSRLTRRRVAEKAEGWMPLLLPPEARATVRTPSIDEVGDLAQTVADMRETAAGRGVAIDVLYPYQDSSFYRAPAGDVGRHQEAFARLADAGVTWMMISGATKTAAETFQFLETVGHNYIHQRSL
jgi:probable F420-dependent oxidoreductase